MHFSKTPLDRSVFLWVNLWAVLLFCAGCSPSRRPSALPTPLSTPPGVVSHPASPVWIRSELYFGISDFPQWMAFLDEVVTPRFPSGLTVFDAYGQWRTKDGRIHPVPTKVLVIVHPPDTASNVALEEIRRTYMSRFHQESVLQTDTPVQVTF